MSRWWRSVATSLGFIKQECSIIIIGLDNAGKSTLVNHLKENPGSDSKGRRKSDVDSSTNSGTVPTIGMVTDSFQHSNIKFTVYDMSGQSKYRNLWEVVLSANDVGAIVFVIDSTDQLRLVVAKDELDLILDQPMFSSSSADGGNNNNSKRKDIPILFYANKMDLPGALGYEDCMDALELSRLQCPWTIKDSNAISGEGVDEGMEWLVEQLTSSTKGGHK